LVSFHLKRLLPPSAFGTLSTTRDFRAVPPKYRTLVPEDVKDYASLNR
jgi:hypothetical protein